MRIPAVIILVIISFSGINSQSLNESSFTRYTVSEGLSHNNITGIIQDSTGFVWISTSNGLNRFNGSRFVQYHSNNDEASLAAEDLTGMYRINSEEIGIKNVGVHIVNTKTGKTRNIFIPYHQAQYRWKYNMIVKIMGDENKNLYILSRSGFYHFNSKDELVSRFDFYKESTVPFEHFFFGRDLLKLDESRFLIVAIDGLYIFNKKDEKVRRMIAADAPVLSRFLDYPVKYYSFYSSAESEMVIVDNASDSIFHANLSTNRLTGVPSPIRPAKDEFFFRSRMFVVNDTTFLLTGHTSGFFRLTLNKKNSRINFDSTKLFRNYLCNWIYSDGDGQLWIGTNKGLFREKSSTSPVEVAEIPASVLDKYPNILFDEVHVSNETIFGGTRLVGSVLTFNKKTFAFESQVNLQHFRKLVQRTMHVYAIEDFDRDRVVFGTDGPLLLYNTKTKELKEWKSDSLPSGGYWTAFLFSDRRNNLWVSAVDVIRYSKTDRKYMVIPQSLQQGSNINMPVTLTDDNDGNLWMGGHGVVRYNVKERKIDVVLDSFPFIKMPDKQINSMVHDAAKNVLWFNSTNNGLIGYEIATGRMKHFTTADGLPDNNISGLLIVGNKLWIAGTSRLSCLDLLNEQITVFSKEDGFPDMPIVNKAGLYYDAATQKLYVPFMQALVRFNPFTITQKKNPPQLFVENVNISGKNELYLPGTSLKSSWKDNELMFTIGTINFSDAAGQQFAYRIFKDENTPWQELGKQTTFNLSNLPPGKHRLQVKSYSQYNRWPAGIKEMVIEITPPFWKKAWFLVAVWIIGVIIIYRLIQWRSSIARRKEMVKTEIEKLKAEDYKNLFELEHISNYFSSSLAGKKSADDVLWDVARNLIGKLNYVDCVLYLWNADKTRMIQKAAFGPKGDPDAIREQYFDVRPGQGIVGHVIETGQPILIDDTRNEPRYRVDDDYRLSEICVPIKHNDEILGVIDCEHHLPGYFTERDLKILTTIATLIANKLKQLESERTLDQKRKELANINEQIAEARLSALQAQMNPHFVFNALNSIKRMILDCDNEKASRYLSKFAQMIRMTLEHSKQTFVTLDENILYLKSYLDMEKLRFDDSFTYQIHTDENLDLSDISIPSMMIQPIVENAIWHGLMPATNDKKINIHFHQQNGHILCTVEDNGIGFNQAQQSKRAVNPHHNSMGIENLRKRINIINEKYGTDCSLEIKDRKESDESDTGTRVTLKLKLINSNI